MDGRRRASRFYARLIRLYPEAHRAAFGEQMLLTFEDSYRHATAAEHVPGAGFWLAVVLDESKGILRERSGSLLFALTLVWACGLMIVPGSSAVGSWPNLVLPTTLLAVGFLIIPGLSTAPARLAATAFALVLVTWQAVVAQDTHGQVDLVAPVLLVACMVFSVKTLAGVHARVDHAREPLWSREELIYGGLAGLIGLGGLALAAAFPGETYFLSRLMVGLIFDIVVPLVCGVAGLRCAERSRSVRSGIYAGLGTLLVAATIWFVAGAAVVGFTLAAIGQQASQSPLAGWHWSLGIILFAGSIGGALGALCGHVARTEASAG